MSTTSYLQTIRSNCQPLEPVATDVEPRLTRLDGIRAVLFDVYGTLFISASGDIGANDGDHRQHALAQTCEQFGLKLNGSGNEAISSFVGAINAAHQAAKSEGIEYPEVDIVEIWQGVLPQIASGDFAQLDFRLFSLAYEVRVNPVWTMPGTAAVLEELSRRGLVLGVVSNAQFFTPLLFPALLNKTLAEFGFSSELLYFSYEHRQAKPGDYLYRLASQQLESRGVSAVEVLYVGNDMLNDVAAAASVGFRTALFAGDQRSLRLRTGDERVEGIEPEVVVTQWSQLEDCLTS